MVPQGLSLKLRVPESMTTPHSRANRGNGPVSGAREFLYTVCVMGHLRHVDVSSRVDADSVDGIDELTGAFPFLPPPRHQLAVEIEHAHTLRRLGDVHDLALIDVDVVRGHDVRPLLKKTAVPVEYLDAVVRPIRDEHPIARVDAHIMRESELAWTGSLFTPGDFKFAISAETVNTMLTIPVGDKDLSCGRGHRFGGHVEGVSRSAYPVRRAPRVQKLS